MSEIGVWFGKLTGYYQEPDCEDGEAGDQVGPARSKCQGSSLALPYWTQVEVSLSH